MNGDRNDVHCAVVEYEGATSKIFSPLADDHIFKVISETRAFYEINFLEYFRFCV